MYRLLFVSLLVTGVIGYTFNDVERLKKHLFDHYNPTIKPVVNQSKPIEINMDFTVRSIVNFDLTNGQLDTMSYITAVWKDEHLSWNGTEFDAIPRLALTDEAIWFPQIAQLNAIQDDGEMVSLLLIQDGTVVQAIARRYTTFCELQMRYYPVDSHKCRFEFISIKYPIEDVALYARQNEVDVSQLSPHGEWTIEKTEASELKVEIESAEARGGGIIFTLFLKRQPAFSLIHRSFPLALLAIGTLFTHIVPLESGERISYAVTVLLAFVFWQAIITEELPNNSSQISLFSVVISMLLFVSASFTIMSAALCRVAGFDSERPIPSPLETLAVKCRRNHQPKDKTRNKRHDKQNGDINVYMNGVIPDDADSNVENMPGEIRRTNSEDLVVNNRPVTWPEVANALDLTLFCIHCVGVVIVTVIFVLIFVLHGDN